MKQRIIKWSIYLIFPILFNATFFWAWGTEHKDSVWLSYAWIQVAYVMMIASPLLSRKTQSKHLFNLTGRVIGVIYFLIELIIGLILILIGLDVIKISVIIQLVPFCMFFGIYLWNLLYNERKCK